MPPINHYCLCKIVRIGSWTRHFLLFLCNFFSFIRSMYFITIESCLQTSKHQETSAKVLRQLQHLTNNVFSHSTMTDLEQEIIAALNQEYHLLWQRGCLFHLSRSIYLHVQQLGVSQHYMNDEQFWTNTRMFEAPSFVLIEDTIQSFKTLAAYHWDEDQVVLDYIESNYIGELRWGGSPQPMFPHKLLNMNIRVQEDLPHTNNKLEGWHIVFPLVFFIIIPISGSLLRSWARILHSTTLNGLWNSMCSKSSSMTDILGDQWETVKSCRRIWTEQSHWLMRNFLQPWAMNILKIHFNPFLTNISVILEWDSWLVSAIWLGNTCREVSFLIKVQSTDLQLYWNKHSFTSVFQISW